jgi:hypothetical protein
LLLRVDVTADKNQTVLTQQQKAQNFWELERMSQTNPLL